MTTHHQVNKAAHLVEYQNETIVSKTLIDKKTGNVTVFAFDKNQGLSEHTAPYDALVHIIDGEATITISGKSSTVRKDDIIRMPANEPHAVYAVTQMKMILIMIRS